MIAKFKFLNVGLTALNNTYCFAVSDILVLRLHTQHCYSVS